MANSLEVYRGDELIFASEGRWLYPLFELERVLSEEREPKGELEAIDKVVGKAAAMILFYIGIRRIHAGMMSEPAREFLDGREVPNSHDELVPRILCRTEELLADIDDPAEAYRIIKRRAEGAA